MLKSSLFRITVAIILLLLLCINYFYFGFGFWPRWLDAISFAFPFLIILYLIRNLWSMCKHDKRLLYGVYAFVVVLSVFVVIVFSYNYIWHNLELEDTINFPNHRIVEVYFDGNTDVYSFVLKERTLYLFAQDKCVYWFEYVPFRAGATIAKQSKSEDNVLIINDAPSSFSIDLDQSNDSSACTCKNSDQEYDICMVDEAITFPFQLLKLVLSS